MRQPQCDELLLGETDAEQQEQSVRGKETERRAQLRCGTEARFPALRRVFNREQRRAAPFAAKPEALPEAQDAQQQRRNPADHLVSREEGDQQGGDAHQHQRREQRRLAAQPVAEMAKGDRPHRPRDEREAEAHQAKQQLRIGAFGRKNSGPNTSAAAVA